MLRRRSARSCGLFFAAILTVACGSAPASVTILHLNDVYEIDAVENGKAGGLARVATSLAALKRTHAPVISTLGGDFLSPSAIGTARVDGEALAGKQMVGVLNVLGLDWATFGNHEFDISESALKARLKEAAFKIVSSNVTDGSGQPFAGTVLSAIVPVKAGGQTRNIGLIGITIDANKKAWVKYSPPIDAAKGEVAKLKGKVDAIVALTHLTLAGDQELVDAVPEIDVVLGGHEHENWLLRRGRNFTPVIKADANVRSVAVVTLTWPAQGGRPSVVAELQTIDERTTVDPRVDAEVKRWTAIAFAGFSKDGFAPDSLVATLPEPLDGRESTVRNRPGTLTDIIASSMAQEIKNADLAIFNGGSVRIDDVLPTGAIREYDIIRVLPFGGKVLKAGMDGSLLAQVLDTGIKNQGTGGYLQTWGVTRSDNRWLIQGKLLNPITRYVVAINEFLLTGNEANLGFLNRTNPRVHDVQEFRDIRRVVIQELKRRFK